ncbi:MAG: bifunctional YncE family protein/alkaline phosphatase family protein [Gammaproteobacteria bacterium]|nr:bifunctional YncE family protein/alkaline phosphatase family protein [Gammaproteobacteria bacterium]
MNLIPFLRPAQAIVLACSALTVSHLAYADADDRDDREHRQHAPAGVRLPTGQYITPLAPYDSVQHYLNPGHPAYPSFVAGGAVRSQLSPDGETLAVLCAGQNNLYKPDGSFDTRTQYIFLYDVGGEDKSEPELIQVIQQPESHVGLVWAPDGNTLYAAGGRDDAVYAYTKTGGSWIQSAKIELKHDKGVGLSVLPNAGGLAISSDGKTLVVANNYNDSISVIDTATQQVRYEHDLRPFFGNNEGTSGGAGGTYPFAVALTDTGIAYVSANRDREVVVVDVSSPNAGHLLGRISLEGNPLGMTLDAAQTRLYVAQDNADLVAVIDTATNTVIDNIDTRAPAGLLDDEDDRGRNEHHGQGKHRGSKRRDDKEPRYTGAAPFSVRISPDGNTLYAVNDGANSVAVIPLRGRRANKVVGLIPTAYAPRDISFSADGTWMYIINGKSNTGPNRGHLTGYTGSITSSTYPDANIDAAPVPVASYPLGDACDEKCQNDNAAARELVRGTNDYQFQLEKSSLVSAPVPRNWMLERLTQQVAENNHYNNADDTYPVMEFLRRKIKHVIYVVKENRTFDQVLGDLDNGSNGDPDLTIFGKAITPNLHRFALDFVTLDNFMDPGDGSMDGWSWSMAGRVTSTEGLTQQLNYGGHGLSYESEGSNRNVPVNWETTEERDAAVGPVGTANYTDAAAAQDLPGGVENLLPGARNHASADAPFGAEDGFIFNAVLEAGGTVRNYGFLVRNFGELVQNPYSAGKVQVGPLDPSLPRADFASAADKLPAGSTDVYFRGYDQSYPDRWRYEEWKREFDMYVENGNLPSLTLFRISHDHMGNFGSARADVNTPETQQADNDLAIGKMVEAVANSRYAKDTLFIIIEDDCQDGPDHVDSHRSTTYVVGPYVKQRAVVSAPYSQVNALRTIEDILGTEHINLNTAFQKPMVEVFDIKAGPHWSYEAVASTVLQTTSLDLGQTPYLDGPVVRPKHGHEYWEKKTRGFDFSDADLITPASYNRVLWLGLKGDKPYPNVHSQFRSEKD